MENVDKFEFLDKNYSEEF